MGFTSILFPGNEGSTLQEIREIPAYFHDLNLDQIVEAIVADRQEYDIKPFFLKPLHHPDPIRYRQEVMRDLECGPLFQRIKTFAGYIHKVTAGVQQIAGYLAEPQSYQCNYLVKGRLLNSIAVYCETINDLMSAIASFDLKSQGLLAFRQYISAYVRTEAFMVLGAETNVMKAELAQVRYCMLIKNTTIKVKKYEQEPDHTVEVEKIFEKFRQGEAKDYRQKVTEEPYAEHVEAGVLNLVAELYPEIFSRLDDYCIRNKEFIDHTLSVFSREVQFYIAYLEYMDKFKEAGFSFCYPQVSEQDKEIRSDGSFDLALAQKLIAQGRPVVCNDFYLQGKERIIVVSGPNQGGKTTFARVYGQLHYLASLGCPVAGKGARLFLFDRIFTHFERQEQMQNLSGKLRDDLIRMRDILSCATGKSIIIINEIFSSTALKDAVTIGTKIMERLVQMDALCVCVTFLDELTSCSEKIVSMVSTVVPEDPVRRTYKIIRSPADGLAYAMHIAQKYRLAYSQLKERIKG